MAEEEKIIRKQLIVSYNFKKNKIEVSFSYSI